MKSISLYVNNGTYLTRLHPYTKCLYIFAAISVPLISGRMSVFGLFILLSLAALASGKVLKRAFPLIAFSFTILIMVFLVQGLFHQGNTHILFSIGALHFYREGVLYATHIGLNILNMLLSFAVLVLSTDPAVLVEALERSGFSPKFGYCIGSVFQIIPQMSGTMSTIMDAQRSRGMETEGKLSTRAKAFLPLISPVVMSSLIGTRERAIALEVRGFGNSRKRTYLKDAKRSSADKILTVLFCLMVIAAIVCRILF